MSAIRNDIGYIYYEAAYAALQAAGGKPWFDKDLNPVVPVEGQWFVEYDFLDALEGPDVLRDEAMVEYLGDQVSAALVNGEWVEVRRPRVIEEGSDSDDRDPRGVILVRMS